MKAQQTLDLPICKRKLRKRWKKRHRAQRKLRKSWKKGHSAQSKLRNLRTILRNAHLWCRPYLPMLQDRIKQHVLKSIRSCSSSQKRILPARECKSLPSSLFFLIKPMEFIFYKLLSVLNIMMAVDSLFLPKAALLSIYLRLKPLSPKFQNPHSADKKARITVVVLANIASECLRQLSHSLRI